MSSQTDHEITFHGTMAQIERRFVAAVIRRMAERDTIAQTPRTQPADALASAKALDDMTRLDREIRELNTEMRDRFAFYVNENRDLVSLDA